MREYFENVSKINYEGANSKNPYSFKYYNPDEIIGDKAMKEHLRFALSYWHTLTATGADPFGVGTMIRPWDSETNEMDLAKARMEAAFELMDKLNIEYFCFHDRDIAPEGKTLQETNKNLDEIVALCKSLMKKYNKKLLWGTANCFTNPRYVHGAGTSCNADVFAYAAAQIKKAIEITKELDGENYVFWGGREGYETLLNTDMGLELDNFARLLQMAVDYAKEIGFTGQFLIEPKPKEPTKHQYDFDAATVLGFLKNYNLDKYFKVNIEANHATLAQHTFQHELHFARINKFLGSIDANQGDPLLGWDTDQFPTNIYDATLAMYEILKNGGLAPGGVNFDSKVRRASFEKEDLFLAYIAGMDTFAKGLRVAYKLLENGDLEDFIKEKYSSFTEGIGKEIVEGKVGFKELEAYALNNNPIINKSGRQELLESIVNQYIFEDHK
ncbi:MULTISPECIES: xylose isomerase [Clostridium]|jgi:D-xylose isomerase (EC 5.3.1.5)|uniref:Xylose isomerase n=2 Tax=Clostridium beijerinckii TaxID=1520 RepID=A0A1S8QRJ4_CLOBE|nr:MULTISPECIES: xylose isomerase [Clostridium]AMQ96031.1 xylose isomerase [Clostridium sp. MF28]ABR34543.1 xylose isomerase [Clostridium beijerinckii NCIMB 8052]AIU04761.1 xylose isomerase [Clostridium beijerinckii ATCC 35702]MBC2459904.1 xylose isomerase [Clostridium beijerinckii]MBC2477392.1 xylose isomerase [Clostridium beijerinckii]